MGHKLGLPKKDFLLRVGLMDALERGLPKDAEIKWYAADVLNHNGDRGLLALVKYADRPELVGLIFAEVMPGVFYPNDQAPFLSIDDMLSAAGCSRRDLPEVHSDILEIKR